MGRTPPTSLRRSACALLVAAGASGCAFFGGEDVEVACPEAGILEAARRLPPGDAPPEDTLSHVASIGGLASDCRYEEEAVEIDLAFTLTATGGPGRNGTPVALPYFVATVGPGESILSKDRFTTELSPVPGESVAIREQLTLRIPLLDASGGPGLRILVGFEPPERTAPAPADLFFLQPQGLPPLSADPQP